MIEAALAELLAAAGEIGPAASHLERLAGEVRDGAAYSLLVDAAAACGAAHIVGRTCIWTRGTLRRLASFARRPPGPSRRIRRLAARTMRAGHRPRVSAAPLPSRIN